MRLGIVGWRGMVGSVLLDRMLTEDDFRGLESFFFSTSQAGQVGPLINGSATPLLDAYSISDLRKMEIIISCQGGDYTKAVYGLLRETGWSGYWIDAASTLRLDPNSFIVLDPINRTMIKQSLKNGCRTFVGGNCTVSLMLMALAGLAREGLLEWISTATYQAVSGAGAAQVKELISQLMFSTKSLQDRDLNALSILNLDQEIMSCIRSENLPREALGYPLAFNVLPFIDRQVDKGQSREEWKGEVETQRILGLEAPIPVDGICVRVPVLRSHSQALTIGLTREVPLTDLEALIASGNDWVRLVPNTREDSLTALSPAAVSGTLEVAIGRVRSSRFGPRIISAFTVGDQLLWGAAEPLRRMVRIICEYQG